MFDVLKKYNVAKGDPLGADYDEMAIDLVDGKTAFWFSPGDGAFLLRADPCPTRKALL